MKVRNALRLVLMAVLLAVTLALTSLAYSTDLQGYVSGLEEGKEYTVAKYNIVSDTWGTESTLDSNTKLSSGIWRITEVGGESAELFVDSMESGKINYWNEDGTTVGDFFGGVKDVLVPGKWTVNTSGAYKRITYSSMKSDTIPTVCIHLDKTKFLTPAEGQSGYAYATPFEGETNLLQESSLTYAFTPEQVVPASRVESMTFSAAVIRTGGLAYTSGYSLADAKGKFCFVVKEPGVEGYKNYSVETNVDEYAGLTVTAPEAMKKADGYVVAITWFPYAYCDDSIYSSNWDTSATSYVHIGVFKGENGLKITKSAYPAPEAHDGFGIIGVDSNRTFEIAKATIDETGTGLELGEWTPYTYTMSRPRDLVGLYAVREVSDGKASDYTLAYAWGNMDERKNVMDLNEAGTHLAVCTDLATFDREKFYPGMWSGAVCSSAGLGKNTIFNHSQVNLTPYNTAKKNYDAATEETLAEAKNKLDAEAAALAANVNGIKYKYAFDDDSIIKTNEAVSFKFDFYCNNSTLETKTLTSKIVAYVASKDGKITTYEKKFTQNYAKTFSFTVNFADFLSEEGYLIAFDVYPNTDNTPDNFVNVGTDGFRYPLTLSASSYTITSPAERPVSDGKPEGLTYAGGVITGLDKNKAYEWAQFDINGIEPTAWTAMPVGEEIAPKCAGLIAIRYLSDGYSHNGSAATYVYVPGTRLNDILHTTPTEGKNGSIIDVVDIVNAGSLANEIGKIKFNEAKWTGITLSSSLALNYGYDRLILGCSSTPLNKSLSIAIRDAANDEALAAARSNAGSASDAIYYSYAYTADEIIPMSDFESFKYRVSLRQGGFKLVGSVQTKFVFKVLDDNGNLVDRIAYKDVSYTKSGTNVTISLSDFTDKSGYIVGIVIHPYVLTEGSYFDFEDDDNGDYNVYLYVDGYKVNAIMPTATPVLSISDRNAIIKVENYFEGTTYAYSNDGGEAWTIFKGDTFAATKASTEYIVKALGDSTHLESEVSEAVVSPAVVVAGTSLVLDGKIGVRVYMDIDSSVISDINFYTTKINLDFKPYENMLEYGEGYRVGGAASFTSGADWLSPVTLDTESGLYYTTFFVAAKDADNIKLECDLGAFLKDGGARVSYSNLNGNSLNVNGYIESARALAAEGDAEIIRALDVIDALEDYLAYTDNYFGEGELPAYATESEMIVDSASRTGALEGATFYGTSLLLEDSVTLRHYFKVSDVDAYRAKYTSDIPFTVKGGYICYDITDIPAQEIGEIKTLTINDSEGKAFEIKYSAANYIETASAKEDTRLVSLVNVMYDYYEAAYGYANPKPLYVKYDVGFSQERAVEGLHLYIPTKEGYIDHTFGHTVSDAINADIWRLSFAYMCDDALANPVAITTTGEWDMALMLSGRPDFIGGNAHGDEVMTDIKFIIDGVETDITTLTEATEFKTMVIVQNSVGYDPLDSTTPVLKHHKEHKITHAGVRLDQRVEWLGDYTLSHSYLAMMPPAKAYTDMYYTNLTEAAEIDLSSGSKYVDGATSVTVYGKESGLYFTMTVNDYDKYIKPYMSIADNGGGAYNKMYFTFVKSGTVSEGDVWETFTHYRIEKK